MKIANLRWALLLAANVAAWCVLSFSGTSVAAPGAKPPFSNSVEQRHEMIRELREIKTLLKEQNALLRAGSDQDTADGRSQR